VYQGTNLDYVSRVLQVPEVPEVPELQLAGILKSARHTSIKHAAGYKYQKDSATLWSMVQSEDDSHLQQVSHWTCIILEQPDTAFIVAPG
jgi:hypothetical protein